MPGQTYDLISHVNITNSTTNSVSFSSISGLYKDLRLVLNVRRLDSNNGLNLRLNNDSVSSYNIVWGFALQGSKGNTVNSSVSAGSGWFGLSPDAFQSSSTVFGTFTVDIIDYTSTTRHKSALWRADYMTESLASTGMAVGRIASTAAVTSIQVILENSVSYFAPNSTFSLYGIAG